MKLWCRLSLLFIVSLISLSLHAGTIRGQISPVQGSVPKIVILKTYLASSKNDTIVVGAFGDFKVDVPYSFPVSCGLNVGRSFFSFLYVPSEKDARINLSTENGVLVKGTIENSTENQAYNELEQVMKEFDRGLFQYLKSNNPQLGNYIEEYNAGLNAFQYKYKGTYVADGIAQMRKIKVDKKLSALANIRTSFFDNVNFADSALVGNPLLGNLLVFYGRAICDTTAPARQQFISGVMKKSEANGYVYRKLALSWFNDIMDEKDEPMMLAYLAWFKTSADTMALPVLHAKTKLLARVMPGQSVIDIKIEEDGKNVASLKQTATENKLTLLMIWESHCSHCREAIPKVKELYEVYKAKGLQVFGVSLDNEQKDWESYIMEKDIKWINIMAMHSTGGVEEYYIQNTPTFVLIDNKGTIVHRLMDVNGAVRYVKAELK